eukprot:CAMPEP_0201510854 /NCGR_PEP_ID=MMETSP0161_2-20130828/3395_1 /ASSEMBLY_ACC=CAM_ASM_000251 /TAXON_ID=180227 /ORGANISM="Neoparamoeba aestuarina, Strain SoJaBio B1-5/56/2" /LENGTH=430 /DNA_ID=CAMNT_0047906107 /DNA_START=76 /DNA_END=1368 /DNA_ORIENTATION=+
MQRLGVGLLRSSLRAGLFAGAPSLRSASCNGLRTSTSFFSSSSFQSSSADLNDPCEGLDEERVAIYDAAKGFADKEMAPFAAKWDEEEIFPVEQLRGLAELGFGGIYCKSSDLGGSELGRLDAAVIFEALSTACVSTTAYLSIHNMCAWMVDEFASQELKNDYLPQLCTMEKMASYCLTEPGAGSDAGSLSTSAVLQGDHYVLNGEKAFISGGGDTDLYVIMARTGVAGPKGISCFLVDKEYEGISFGKKEKKLGWNSQPTRAVILENVKVPASNLIGREGDGFKIAMAGLDGGRVNIAACSVGGAHACFEAARDYTKVRKAFGSPLSSLQSVQFTLAEMAVDLYSSRELVRGAARKMDAKHPRKTEHCAMAKFYATEKCFEVCDRALQLHGGYGYLKDYPVERYLRDLRVHKILEGTNQIMRLITSRVL